MVDHQQTVMEEMKERFKNIYATCKDTQEWAWNAKYLDLSSLIVSLGEILAYFVSLLFCIYFQ